MRGTPIKKGGKSLILASFRALIKWYKKPKKLLHCGKIVIDVSEC